MAEITEELLNELRASLDGLSEKRRNHVLAVERMAERIGSIYMPESVTMLRAAALLHDITKEYTVEEHLEVFRAHGYTPLPIELAVPKTMHAMSAAMLTKDRYPGIASHELLGAIRWHTTGRAFMSLPEKIIFFSDYIDDTRKYPECVRLRDMFWDPDPASMTEEEREKHLNNILTEALDTTIRELLEGRKPFHPSTIEARNSLIMNGK